VSVKRAIEGHLASHQVARVIYGAIIGLALVVALKGHPPKPWVVVGSILGTAVAVGLAEFYSEYVGAETRTRRRVTAETARHIRANVVAVATGISFPAVFFVLAAAGAIDEDRAFAFAQWSGLGVIGAYGYFGARLRGAGRGPSLLNAAAVGLIGGFLIALKAILH
jgi:hypothetical protein